MPKLTLAGHPLHTMLNDLPLGTLPFSAAMDVLHAITGRRGFAEAAYYSLAAGVVGAAAAGAAGVADYLEIPNDTETKQVANAHAVLNVGLLGLSAANLLLRREDREPGPVGLILSLMGTAGLAVSAWYGGQLVFEHGVRVRNAQPLERAPEARIPGSEQVERALLRAEGTMPRRGPTDRRAESDERMAVEARY